MKVHDIGGHGGPHRPDGPGKPGDLRGPSTAKQVERDRVELSGVARERQALVEAANELSEIRSEKVADLRQSIESGSYAVDVRQLARAILELEDGLFS
jgi:flagellar biosynthesis anti-sigma factor FlgM